MTGLDTYMVTGGGPGSPQITEGSIASFGLRCRGSSTQCSRIWFCTAPSPTSRAAFALGAWAAFMYVRSKTPEDRAFYDWAPR